MDVSSLKEDTIPLVGFDHIQNVANIQLLILRRLIVLLNLAKHANNGEQSVFFQLGGQLKVAREVRLQERVLDERERRGVKLFDEFVNELVREETERHFRIHIIFEHQEIVVLLFYKTLRLLTPLFKILQWQVFLKQ